MSKLSTQKMQEIRKAKGMTYTVLAKHANISKSTVEKIFGGFNDNPSLNYLEKIAKALDCSIDDFIEYDTEPTSPYYLDRQTGKIAQEMLDNPELKVLFDASKRLKPEDIKVVTEIVNRLANRE